MKARRSIDKKYQERIRNEVEAEFQKQSKDMANRFFKLFCVALHREPKFRFGKYRLSRVLQVVNDMCVEAEKDEIFWYHVDRIVIEEIGLDFVKEDYDRMDE